MLLADRGLTLNPVAAVAASGTFPALSRGRVTTLQFNIGRLCNQACLHCHVDSSPARSGAQENASAELVDDLLALLAREPQLTTLDLTGGAPELNPHFRRLVEGARALGRTVYVRHNLTVQGEPGQQDLPAYFACHGVELWCSLPCYLEDNVDRQRGRGVFLRSLDALRALNAVGYGKSAALPLHLVYNPQGPVLPPPQTALEEDYRRILRDDYEVVFTRLVTITNQPIHRFRAELERRGALDDYQALLVDHFNPATLDGLMCRSGLSVRWDGSLHDCDFNLVLDLPAGGAQRRPRSLKSLLASGLAALEGAPIAVDRHCYACTAGSGSSCGGALVV